MGYTETISKYRTAAKPYAELIKFLVVIVLFHLFWKWTMSANADDTVIQFLMLNISKPFLWISNHFVALIQFVLNDLFGMESYRYNQQIYFENSPGIRIVWACSGVKQFIMMVLVVAVASGSWIKKAWFIPLSLLFLYLLNVVRLVGLTIVTRSHMEWFDFSHKIVFRIIIYGGIFIMWWLWVEKIAPQSTKKGD